MIFRILIPWSASIYAHSHVWHLCAAGPGCTVSRSSVLGLRSEVDGTPWRRRHAPAISRHVHAVVSCGRGLVQLHGWTPQELRTRELYHRSAARARTVPHGSAIFPACWKAFIFFHTKIREDLNFVTAERCSFLICSHKN